MQYKCLAYTSLAALDLDQRQLKEIHDAARDLNGIDGISGLLIFNGTHFLQWIEGPHKAVDELLERLRRDPRHSGVEVREEQQADERLFGDWTMELVQVRGHGWRSSDELLSALPCELPAHVRDRIATMIEQVAAEVEL